MKGFNKILLWRSARCAMNQGRRKAGDARLTTAWDRAVLNERW